MVFLFDGLLLYNLHELKHHSDYLSIGVWIARVVTTNPVGMEYIDEYL